MGFYPALLRGGDRDASPGAGKEAERRYQSPAWKAYRLHPSLSETPYADLGFHILSWFFGAPDRTDPTAGRDRPAPWNPRSGFEGEGAIQGDVSRPKQSGGRVTATEKKLIARGRLSPTKEVTGGRRATLAQESGASAGFRGRGADCATSRSRGVRGFMRSRSRPQRPRPGSLSAAKSAGTGQKKSTKCRRGGPVAAQRSSGLPRRQGGSPSGADGRGC